MMGYLNSEVRAVEAINSHVILYVIEINIFQLILRVLFRFCIQLLKI